MYKVKEIGSFNLDSVSCCIRLVTTQAFCGARIMKDKIRVHFRLDKKIKSDRFWKTAKISANRYNYQVDINSKEEIDEEVVGWIKEAYSV